jgi:hypothetical protein
VRHWPLLSAILLTVASMTAQDRPNFSGEWVRVEPPHESTTVLTVEQSEQFIRIEQIFPTPRSGTFQIGVAGGIAGALGGGPTWGRQWSTVWRDATLVITQQESLLGTGDPQVQSKHEEIWSLDSKGLLLVLVTDEETGAAATTTRFVYRRSR